MWNHNEKVKDNDYNNLFVYKSQKTNVGSDGCNFGTTAYLDLNSTTNVFNSRSFDQQKVNSCRFVFIFTF